MHPSELPVAHDIECASHVPGMDCTCPMVEAAARHADEAAAKVRGKIAAAQVAPVVRRGDVALTLTHELALLVGEWKQGKEFVARVHAAANGSAAEWLELRDALRTPEAPDLDVASR